MLFDLIPFFQEEGVFLILFLFFSVFSSFLSSCLFHMFLLSQFFILDTINIDSKCMSVTYSAFLYCKL